MLKSSIQALVNTIKTLFLEYSAIDCNSYKLSVPKKKTQDAVFPDGLEMRFKSLGGLAIYMKSNYKTDHCNKFVTYFKKKDVFPILNSYFRFPNIPCQARGRILSSWPCFYINTEGGNNN